MTPHLIFGSDKSRIAKRGTVSTTPYLGFKKNYAWFGPAKVYPLPECPHTLCIIVLNIPRLAICQSAKTALSQFFLRCQLKLALLVRISFASRRSNPQDMYMELTRRCLALHLLGPRIKHGLYHIPSAIPSSSIHELANCLSFDLWDLRISIYDEFATTHNTLLSPSTSPAFGLGTMDETLNPAKLNSELVLKPIISELVRTQVCFPNLKLLVDRISVVTLSSSEQSKSTKAYRLYLTDGEKSIQGRPKHHFSY